MEDLELIYLTRGVDFEGINEEICKSRSLSELLKVRDAIELLIERIIRKNVSDDKLYHACLDSFEGGRRLKPLLVLLGFTIQNRPVTPFALFLAVIVEFFTSVLIAIDDVVDRDKIHGHRGTLSVYGLYASGGSIVIVSLLSKIAVASLAKFASNALKVYLNLFERSVTIQFDNALKENKSRLTTRKYLRNIQRTNGFFYELCFRLASVYSEGHIGVQEKLAKIGRLIGIAEQLCDDLEDIGEDLQKGYQTLPAILVEQTMPDLGMSGRAVGEISKSERVHVTIEKMIGRTIEKARVILKSLVTDTESVPALKMSSIELLNQILAHIQTKTKENGKYGIPRSYRKI